MFNADFYPTPPEVINSMLSGYSLEGKTILEPSAGKGNIVDFCIGSGAFVIGCESNFDLRKIVSTKCQLIGDDFLKVTSDKISHIDMIVMNPPFSADEKHIIHAFNIAPPGCDIIALCNHSTLNNRYSKDRMTLGSIVEAHGSFVKLGDVFSTAERKTYVEVALVRLKKSGENNKSEFEGFFMEEEPAEDQYNGLMPYNFVRDLVNRYVGAVKIYDEQLSAAVKMNYLTSGFYTSKMAFTCTEEGVPKHRNEYKKDLQKEAWNFIFNKMNMQKYATRSLKEDINKFVEQQSHIPFTMRNIYRMLDIVIGTQEQRMDKALIEVFDKLTMHYDENRYNVEGWKTNSHYLMNQKFIMPGLCTPNFSGGMGIQHGTRYEIMDDLTKALCYITGENYNDHISLWEWQYAVTPETAHLPSYQQVKVIRQWNTWYDWGFFEVKGFKKGTMHFKFKDIDVWGKLNQRVAKIKGYPLFENTKK